MRLASLWTGWLADWLAIARISHPVSASFDSHACPAPGGHEVIPRNTSIHPDYYLERFPVEIHPARWSTASLTVIGRTACVIAVV